MRSTFPRWLVVVISLAILVLMVGTATFYRTQRQQFQQEAVKNLQTVAQLKVGQIEGWRANHLANANVLMNNQIFVHGVADWMANPLAEGVGEMRSWLQSLQDQYGYRDALLVDVNGRVRLSIGGSVERLHPDARGVLATALRDRKVVMTDLHERPNDPAPHLEVIAPLIVVTEGKSTEAGAVILQIDPRRFLFPLIQSWPLPSNSAETLLVRRDGDSVLFLNDLRHKPGAALQLRIPLSQVDLPAVMAVLGKEGPVEGVDYRGIRVLSVLRAVQGSPWFMVAKVDKAEAFERARFFSVLILALFLGLFVAAVAAVGVVWQRNAKTHFRALFREEETRRRIEERHRITLMSVGDGVIATDTQSRVELMNPVAATLCGWSQEEAASRPVEEVFRIVNEGTRKDVENPVRRVMREGVVVGLANHTVLVARDGTERPIADSGAPIRNEKNEIVGAVLVFRDQTDERIAECALQTSEERYRRLFEHMREGFAYCEMIYENGEPRDFVYLTVNDAFEKLTGLVGVTGKRVTEVIPGIREADPELFQIYGRVAREGAPEKFEIFVDALRHWFSISVYCPERGFFVAIFDVITERKKAEEDREKLEMQVRQAQKMEAVGTLAGGIAHDFNNSLTGIIGFGELLRRRMAGDPQALHDLDEILSCAERGATLTRDLLAYARRQVIEPVRLNVSELVDNLTRLISKVVSERIELVLRLDEDVPTIHADRGQIEQVVMNLCLNARDAMPAGGRLMVETKGVYLEREYVHQHPYMEVGRYALLTVSDTGVGMDEKTQERVYDPFFTTKGPDQGTGLGLAVVYGIVKQHGGFIHLYSEPGEGTAFNVYFPATEDRPDVVAQKPREEILRGGGETILLGEDEEAIRSLGERVLTDLGYNVLVARDGEEALELFRRHPEVALVLLDVVMPRMGGKEAFEEMQKETPNVKVIFMSGYTANAIHDSFVLVPGTPFLQKPFGPSVLARKIREVLDTT